MPNERPSLLIVSFSDIENDARVKKQITLFAEHYRVVTCGRGPAIRPDVEHLQIDAPESKPVRILQAVALRLGLHRLAFAFEPEVRAARKALRGRRFDVAIANDIESISVAAEFSGYAGTHADLHEYWPGLHDQIPAWVKIRQPYYRWMIREHAARAGSATTVSQAIAERYEREFGFRPGVVHNATPYHALKAVPVGSPLRIVHSGGAQPNRQPEVMMRAVALSSAPVQMDMYLTGQHTAYGASLLALADELGDRVRILPPKPYDELIETLNQYDIGIHILPPTNTNNVLALPNKLFDYVQARLGVIVGPTPDMQQRVEEFGLGTVTSGFAVEDVVEELDRLTAEQTTAWKQHSEAAAEVLNVEHELPVWKDAIDALRDRARD